MVLQWFFAVCSACFKSRVQLMAENMCLRQQLVVLKRRQKRSQLVDSDRRFWILVSRWFVSWRDALIIVQPETVLGWHCKGWKAYWRWRSRRGAGGGRRRIPPELRALIRRLARENVLWGQQRIQGELARLGFSVCARTVAKYMRKPYDGIPSPGWQRFLKNTPVRSGRVTCSRCVRSGFARSTSFSSSTTEPVRSYIPE